MCATCKLSVQCVLLVSAGASVKTSQQVQGNLEAVWAGAIQPLVMGLAGASVYIPALPSGTALRALALSAIGESSMVTCTLLFQDWHTASEP